MNRKKVRI